MESEHTNGHAREDHAITTVASFLRNEIGIDETRARAEASNFVHEVVDTVKGTRAETLRAWWAFTLKGVLAIAAGVMFLARPLESTYAMALVLGAWIFVDGVIALASAFSARHRSWTLALSGAVGIALGYLIFTRTGGAMIVFYVLTATWALGHGVADVATAAAMRSKEPGRASLAVLGIVAFCFGILLLVAPIAGLVTLGWWIGLYAIAYGVLSLVISFQARHLRKEIKQAVTTRLQPPTPQPA